MSGFDWVFLWPFVAGVLVSLCVLVFVWRVVSFVADRQQRLHDARHDLADAFVDLLEKTGEVPSRCRVRRRARALCRHRGCPRRHRKRVEKDDAYRQKLLMRAARRQKHQRLLLKRGYLSV